MTMTTLHNGASGGGQQDDLTHLNNSSRPLRSSNMTALVQKEEEEVTSSSTTTTTTMTTTILRPLTTSRARGNSRITNKTQIPPIITTRSIPRHQSFIKEEESTYRCSIKTSHGSDEEEERMNVDEESEEDLVSPPITPLSSVSSSPTSSVLSISKAQLATFFSLPQPEAAKRLGISLSTLKRRFYEMYGGGQRWPYVLYKRAYRKTRLSFLVNRANKPTKTLDPHTIHALKLAFAKYSKSSSVVVGATNHSPQRSPPSHVIGGHQYHNSSNYSSFHNNSYQQYSPTTPTGAARVENNGASRGHLSLQQHIQSIYK